MGDRYENEGNIVEDPVFKKKLWTWIAVSASILMLAGGLGAYFFGARSQPANLQDVKGKSIVTIDRTSQPPADSPKTPINQADYKTLNFDILGSYTYKFPNSDGKPIKKGELKSQIPENIRAFDGKKIAIQGYMIPMEYEDNGAKRFVLSQFVPACCFGDTIRMNQWIDVQMADGKRTKYHSMELIVIFGTLEVGEELQDGYVASLYRFKADEVIAPEQTKKM
jgi:hypothetical protein